MSVQRVEGTEIPMAEVTIGGCARIDKIQRTSTAIYRAKIRGNLFFIKIPVYASGRYGKTVIFEGCTGLGSPRMLRVKQTLKRGYDKSDGSERPYLEMRAKDPADSAAVQLYHGVTNFAYYALTGKYRKKFEDFGNDLMGDLGSQVKELTNIKILDKY